MKVNLSVNHLESFFIAERFFEGEFIEFNNKYGYINDNTEKINALS